MGDTEDLSTLKKDVGELKTLVALGNKDQQVMQRDLASLAIVVQTHMTESDKVEDDMRQTLIRIEMKLAKWTGMFVAGYALLGIAWVIMEFLIR